MVLKAATTALALALAGCQPLSTAPATATTTQATVEHNADAAALLAALRQRGIVVTPNDVSVAEFLADDPGYSYHVGADWLHVHVYPSPAAAAAAKARFVAGSATSMIDWVGKPHLFQCGTALALYLGEQAASIAALTQRCGPPAAPR